MSADLRELYQEAILDHHRRPRNFGLPTGPAHSARGHNPLCGDRVTVHVGFDGDVLREVRFQGIGCAISTASASMMTEAMRGKTRAEAEALIERFHALLTGSGPDDGAGLGKLAVFSGVREFPVRVKCATLPWHTLRSAFSGAAEPVTTE